MFRPTHRARARLLLGRASRAAKPAERHVLLLLLLPLLHLLGLGLSLGRRSAGDRRRCLQGQERQEDLLRVP